MIQALFFDEFIYFFMDQNVYTNKTHLFLIQSINIACTIIAFGSIASIIKEEIMELKTFNKERVEDHPSVYEKIIKHHSDDIATLTSDGTESESLIQKHADMFYDNMKN